MKKAFPDWEVGGNGRELGDDRTVFTEAGRAEELLKRMARSFGWTDLETSVRRNCEAFL